MAVIYSQNGVIVKPTGFDVIGGKKYKTVQMPDGKEWLAENLDLRISANDVYYNNDETTYGWNGRKYGLLYNKDDCIIIYDYLNKFYPEWRLPTESDWNDLLSSVNNDASKLKSTQYWPVPGTDDYGFNAMPSGYNYDVSTFESSAFVAFIEYTGLIKNIILTDTAEIGSWRNMTARISIRLVRDAS